MKLNPFWMLFRWSRSLASAAVLAFSLVDLAAADPVISNVRAAQRTGTRLVDIDFDVTDPDSQTLQISVEVSDNAGVSYTVPAVSLIGDVGYGIKPGSGKSITWDAKKDWPNQYSSKVRFRVLASDVWLPPRSMALIPAGVFTMGDARVVGPAHPVQVSAFAIDRTEVTAALWREVQSWGLEHGYDLTAGGSWGSDDPIHSVNWFDVVKWCNARSEKEGLTPAYYLDEARTQVYRTGDKVPTVNWNGGYRLTTEAEWEKAARGGVEGKLYPWADSEDISDERLNYNKTDKFGRTTPVGSYPANGYGLRDMAGNVWEWVWDWHAEYPGGLVSDPRGPPSGTARLIRGGGWPGAAEDCRVADRIPFTPENRGLSVGFRAILPPDQTFPASAELFPASAEFGDVTLDTYPGLLANGLEIDGATRLGDRAEICLISRFPAGQIFYTMDGSEPTLDSTRYSGPFTISNSVVLRAYSISSNFTKEATNDPVSIQIVPTFTLATPVIGKGRVDRSPSLIRYLQDDVVAVNAVPEEGWRFVRWEEDLSGSFPERNLALSRDKVVRAVFKAIPRFTLTTVAKGGSVTGGGSFYQGSQVKLSASPAANWTFLNWSGDYVGAETNFSWVVDGPATFEARFGTAVGTLATGHGRILLEPDLPLYPYGSQVKVIPVPDAGNALALWGEAGTGQPKTEWVLTVTNGAPRVTALFRALAADKVALTIQSTLGGRVTQPAVDGLYAKGSSVSLTAVPDSGYEFVGWSGDASGAALGVDLTLDTSKTVRAEFRRAGVQTHPLTLTLEGPGTVRRIPDLGAYEVGSDVELVAEPFTDAAFLGWSGAVTSTQRRVRVTITGPLSVQALFRPIHPVVNEVRGEGQVLLSPPEGRYVAGTELALTAKPAEGWGFVQWSGDLSTTGQEATLTVDAPKRVIVEFARLGTVTTRVMGSGTISKTPDAPSYLPGTPLTLKAVPQAGWKFLRWTGGATGTNAELQVVVGRTEAIVAEFTDVEPPVLAVLEPQSGTVTSEKFRLKGTATDNVGGLSVGWTWNGVPQAALKLNEGAFETEELTLKVGQNRLEVTALDGAGNESRVVREVIWTPVRTLAVGTAPEAQEGKRLVFPVTLSAPGDVGGLTFQLRYDPALLADPQFEWGALVGQSVNNLNLSTPGEIGASFSLAGLALPEGTQPVATVSFRARSVPGLTNATLTPVIGSLATPTGSALSSGNAAVAGEGRILPRKIRGDNNANQRIDVGDAVVISRLQLALDEVRPWDVPLNDLNDTGTIDNGDVIKALRIVVGLDLQPKAAPASGRLSDEGGVLGGALSRPVLQSTAAPTGDGADADISPTDLSPTDLSPREAALNPQLSALSSQPRRSLRLSGNTNDVLGLEFPDGPVAQTGKPYRVVVKLLRSGAPISGASFTLNYPSALKVIQKEVGALVPSDALPLWGEVSGGVNLAAIRSTLWPTGSGVMAIVTFMPTDQIMAQPIWPVELVKGEVTGAGFDIRALGDVRGEIRSEAHPPVEPKVVVPTPNPAGGPLAFDIEAGAGAAIVLETTTDLSSWTEDRRLTGQGAGNPVRVTVTPDPTARARFWRVRVQ